MPIFKKKNEDFFAVWSAEMAYVLGLLAADGALIKNNRGAYYVEIQSVDKELIEIVGRLICPEHKISARRKQNANWNQAYRLQIGSKKIFRDLVRLGLTPRKSRAHRLSSSVKDSFKLYHFMYKNDRRIYLTRKKETFEKYFAMK